MQPINLSYTPAAVTNNNVFLNQTVVGAGTLILNGAGSTDNAWVSPDSLSHLISFTAVLNASATTFTITGFEDIQRRIPKTEDVLAPNATTVIGTTYFAVITSITTNVGLTVAASGSFAQAAHLPRTVLNYMASPVTVGIGVVISGTINFTVRHSFDDPQNVVDDPTWFNTLNMNAKTANTEGNLAAGTLMSDVLITTYTTGATLKVTYVQGAFGN